MTLAKRKKAVLVLEIGSVLLAAGAAMAWFNGEPPATPTGHRFIGVAPAANHAEPDRDLTY